MSFDIQHEVAEPEEVTNGCDSSWKRSGGGSMKFLCRLCSYVVS